MIMARSLSRLLPDRVSAFRENLVQAKVLLLRAIADLDQHSGEIGLQNQSQNSMSGPQWRQLIGYLPPDSIFWADTVAEHFNGLQKTPWLKQAIHKLRIGALLNQPIAKLSSGEKQRLGLFRLLANQPRALLLDEPTSHLDQDMKLAAEATISGYQLKYNCPLILVSHDTAQCKRMTGRHFIIRNKRLSDDLV